MGHAFDIAFGCRHIAERYGIGKKHGIEIGANRQQRWAEIGAERVVFAHQPQLALQQAVGGGVRCIKLLAGNGRKLVQKVGSRLIATRIIVCAFTKQERFARVITREKCTQAIFNALKCPIAIRQSGKRGCSVHIQLAIWSKGFLMVAWTGMEAFASAWPTTISITGFSLAGLPQISLRKFIGLGVCVSVANLAA